MKVSAIIALLVLSLITGAISALIARKKGRSLILWFAMGFVLNIIALLAIMFLFQTTRNALDRKQINSQNNFS